MTLATELTLRRELFSAFGPRFAPESDAVEATTNVARTDAADCALPRAGRRRRRLTTILLTGTAGCGKRTAVLRAARHVSGLCEVCECSLLSVVRSARGWTDEVIEDTFRTALRAARRAQRGDVLILFRRLPDLILARPSTLGGGTSSFSAAAGGGSGDLAAEDAKRACRKFVQCLSALERAVVNDEGLRIALVATSDSMAVGSIDQTLRACFTMNIAMPTPSAAERAILLNRFFLENTNIPANANHNTENTVLAHEKSPHERVKCASLADAVSAASLDVALGGKLLSGNDVGALGRASICLAFERNLINSSTIAPREIDVLESARAFVPSSRRTHSALSPQLAQACRTMADADSTVLQHSPRASDPPRSEKEKAQKTPGWDAIGGLAEAKRALLETVVWSYTRRSSLTRLGIRPSKGVLLYGPPGTGKTLIASVAAKVAGINFVGVTFTDLIRSAVGESEAAIAAMFAEARRNSPCVLFIDEIQAIFGNRENTGNSGQNMVSQLMQEIDGLGALSRGATHTEASSKQQSEHLAKHVVLLAATNAPHALDRALLRPGRIDRVVYVGLPDMRARVHICEGIAEKIRSGRHQHRGDCSDDDTVEDELLKASTDIARLTDGFSGADITAVYQRAIGRALSQSEPAANMDILPQILSRHVRWVLEQGFLPSVTAQQVGALKSWGERHA